MKINDTIIETKNIGLLSQDIVLKEFSGMNGLSLGISAYKNSDSVTISQEGQNLYDLSVEKDFGLNNVLIGKENLLHDIYLKASHDYINTIFVYAISDHQNQLHQLKTSESGGIDSLLVSQLNETFLKTLEKNVGEIGTKMDVFFDKGSFLNDIYSEYTHVDLFDKEVFAAHLIKSVLHVRDKIINEPGTQRLEDIDDMLMESSETQTLEKMSYSDMKVLYKFISEPLDFEGFLDEYDTDSGQYIAAKQKFMNGKINDLNIAFHIKDSMYKVYQRVSDGQMKQLAFQEETHSFMEEMKRYNHLLMLLKKQLNRLNVRIDKIGELFGITPDNNRLLKYLGRRQKLTDAYNELMSSKSKAEDEFSYLNNNKYEIVNKDSYKRIKHQYDEEMNADSEEKNKVV